MRRLLLLPISLLALAGPLGGGTAAAEIAEEAEPAPMSIQFPQRHAELLGPRALVPVECSGEAAAACEGTLVLRGHGSTHKVPYVIQAGVSQSLAVPLGEGGGHGSTARVVARTLQWTGDTVRTSTLLRLIR